MNHCISTVEFPKLWKESLIQPTTQGANPTSVSKLRPIRIQSQFTNGYKYSFPVLPVTQSGSKHTCAESLLGVADDIFSTTDDNKLIYYFYDLTDSVVEFLSNYMQDT